jgi:hypothetical protein
MTRRLLLCALALARYARAAEELLRGKLQPQRRLESNGRTLQLEGDEPTRLVLDDERLLGRDLSVMGELIRPDHFRIVPIHRKSLFVWNKDQKQLVSYWCDICYIRTWSPGKCWCCQEETRFDPINPE